MEEIAKCGIYTPEDIEEARRNILYPVRQERVIRQFVETIMQKDSCRMNYELMFGPDHYHKADMMFLIKIWGQFTVKGIVVLAIM